MALLDKISKGKIITPQKVILYVVAGIGKTTLINEGAPHPIFIDTESGSNEVAVERIRVSDHKEMFDALKDLYHEKHNYETVVLDSIDWTEKFLERKVCEHGGVDGVSCDRIEDIGGGWGKGFKYLREEFTKFLFKLNAFSKKGINVVLIGHSEVVKFQPPGETVGYDRYVLRLDKENAQNAIEWAGTVLFGDYKTHVVEQNKGKAVGVGGKERVLYTVHCPAWDAKNRFNLDEKAKWHIETLGKIFGSYKFPTEAEANKQFGEITNSAAKQVEVTANAEEKGVSPSGETIKEVKTTVSTAKTVKNNVVAQAM